MKSTSIARLLSRILTLLLVCYGSARKKDRNVPHGHRGKLQPYLPGPFAVKLTASEEAKLKEGHDVMKQTMPDDPSEAGGAICIQDVEAPIAAVWHQILDLDNYSKKVSKVLECKNYLVQKHADGRVTLKTKQVLGVLPGYSYESYYDHTFYPKQSSMTWSLDYDKTSDFDDCAGHWHVAEHPARPWCSRVFYACDIQMKGHVPGPILNYISKAALKQATAWVKKESEAHPDLTVSAMYGGDKMAKHQQREPELATAGAATSSKKGLRRLWGGRK